jgi:hypothetical protein
MTPKLNFPLAVLLSLPLAACATTQPKRAPFTINGIPGDEVALYVPRDFKNNEVELKSGYYF